MLHDNDYGVNWEGWEGDWESYGQPVLVDAKPEEAKGKPTTIPTSNHTGNLWVSDKCGKVHDAAQPIQIGGFPVWLGKSMAILPATLLQMDFVCPLNGQLPENLPFGQWMMVLGSELTDRGGVPANWSAYIHRIAEELKLGRKVAAWCTGSHGRTGTLGASLIAVLEPDVADPIDAIRQRHCFRAVESREQAVAIFALRGENLPAKYDKEFPLVKWEKWKGGGKSKPNTLERWPQRDIDPQIYGILREAWQHVLVDGWFHPYWDKQYGNEQRITIMMDESNSKFDQRVAYTAQAVTDAICQYHPGEALGFVAHLKSLKILPDDFALSIEPVVQPAPEPATATPTPAPAPGN